MRIEGRDDIVGLPADDTPALGSELTVGLAQEHTGPVLRERLTEEVELDASGAVGPHDLRPGHVDAETGRSRVDGEGWLALGLFGEHIESERAGLSTGRIPGDVQPADAVWNDRVLTFPPGEIEPGAVAVSDGPAGSRNRPGWGFRLLSVRTTDRHRFGRQFGRIVSREWIRTDRNQQTCEQDRGEPRSGPVGGSSPGGHGKSSRAAPQCRCTARGSKTGRQIANAVCHDIGTHRRRCYRPPPGRRLIQSAESSHVKPVSLKPAIVGVARRGSGIRYSDSSRRRQMRRGFAGSASRR